MGQEKSKYSYPRSERGSTDKERILSYLRLLIPMYGLGVGLLGRLKSRSSTYDIS